MKQYGPKVQQYKTMWLVVSSATETVYKNKKCHISNMHKHSLTTTKFTVKHVHFVNVKFSQFE